MHVIPEEAEVIYFGFELELSIDSQLPVEFIWFIDGHQTYSSLEPFNEGYITASLNRLDLGMPEFKNGLYEVKAFSNKEFLTSARFKVE